MNPVEFLFEKLNEIHEDFFDISIRYEYDAEFDDHIVEILPYSAYRNNEVYASFELSLISQFSKLYPGQNLMFVSKGSLIEVEKPILILPSKIDQLFDWTKPVPKSGEKILTADSYYTLEEPNYHLAA